MSQRPLPISWKVGSVHELRGLPVTTRLSTWPFVPVPGKEPSFHKRFENAKGRFELMSVDFLVDPVYFSIRW